MRECSVKMVQKYETLENDDRFYFLSAALYSTSNDESPEPLQILLTIVSTSSKSASVAFKP